MSRSKEGHTMQSRQTTSRFGALFIGTIAATAAGALVAAIALSPRPAVAKPEYAAQTKLGCASCHVNPAGGGALKPLGAKFKANGYKLK
jgi:hypothetical protein